MKSVTINTIALIILIAAVGLMVFLFAESRGDPSLRIAALVSGTGLVSALAAIASTILTGKDLTKNHDAADLPPNSSTTATSTIQVGPAPPPPVTDPKP
jgi:hypothetical protein